MRRLGLLWLFVVLWVLGCGRQPGCSSFSNKVGLQAPEFTLVSSSDSKTYRLSELYHKNPVLLVFWASWCPSCIKEISVLNRWVQDFAPLGLKILGINIGEDAELVQRFASKHAIKYPVLLDPDSNASKSYNVAGVPTIILLAKGGKILYYGFSLPHSLEALLKEQETLLQ